jgi:hypothetical protein
MLITVQAITFLIPPNNWKKGPSGEEVNISIKCNVMVIILAKIQLAEEEKTDVRIAANGHCVVSGRREKGHECAHVVPRATSEEAFVAFAKAAGFLDPTFPFLRNLKDPGNIMFITIALHSGLESECVAIYLPLVESYRALSPFINSMALIAPTLELHYWSGAVPPPYPQKTALRTTTERANGIRQRLSVFFSEYLYFQANVDHRRFGRYGPPIPLPTPFP